MTKRKPKKVSRLEPADVLQARMEYYNGLARAEMKKCELGSREKIDECLKQAQDAAKELGPYRHGRAQAGDSADGEPQKTYVVRVAGPDFKTVDEWLFYYKLVFAKTGYENKDEKECNDRMLQELLERFHPGETRPS